MNWKPILAAMLLGSMTTTPALAGRLADVTVYDSGSGRVLPVHAHDGRSYIVGQPGNEYQIRIRNRTGAEVLAVVSVDGVNAVSGETAGWNQTGYVLAPYQTLSIKGWRKNLQRVAAFYFTEHANSYAARTGRPHNVGVIGVALFRKRVDADARIDRGSSRAGRPGKVEESPFPDDQERARDSVGRGDSADAPAPFGAAGQEPGEASAGLPRSAPRQDAARERPYTPEPLARKSSSLGTGHGRSRTSHARYTSFERAGEHPAQIVAIHYDTYGNLVRLGVLGSPRIATPFPGAFVPDPM
ncbi:MAG TPA: hypothetical protein VD839_00410 [Burkholderiales bacterium]|nr:hypothetical protein [Burkholderiales bacterium]